MKSGPVLTVSLLIYIVVSSVASAQVVDIPDPNLQAAIRHALHLDPHSAITVPAMEKLTVLTAYNRGITDLTGLETAIHLHDLAIAENPCNNLLPLKHLTGLRRLIAHNCNISDVTPLARLRLQELNLRSNPIVDLSPLAELAQLRFLDLSHCVIKDISPLAQLVNLQVLQLNYNMIEDVRPLQSLSALYKLEINHNLIADHSPIDSLALTTFVYDQICDMPPLPLAERLYNRTYPSVFSQWGTPVTNRPELSYSENMALHDMRFGTQIFNLRYHYTPSGTNLVGNLDRAIEERNHLLTLNPHRIELLDVGIVGAPLSYYSMDSPFWIRDEKGDVVVAESHIPGARPSGFLDFTHPAVQDHIVAQAIAVDKCGLYDGIFFDYWSEEWTVLGDFRTMEQEQRARDIIIQRIRANTRPDFLIMGNTNDRIIPRTAPYINGGFMETVIPFSQIDPKLNTGLTRTEASLYWLDNNLREPRINGLEGSAIPTEPPDSLTNQRWMRAITTLSLTHSNGFIVYVTRDVENRHWYDFWDVDLGRPVEEKGQLYQGIDGLYIREFTNGWAVYNHSGETQGITLPELATGVASEVESVTHTLPNIDGEMYLRVKPKNPADVNGDGVVNILDLTLVAQGLTTDKPEADVNGDGVVNVFDLVFVAGEMQ